MVEYIGLMTGAFPPSGATAVIRRIVVPKRLRQALPRVPHRAPGAAPVTISTMNPAHMRNRARVARHLKMTSSPILAVAARCVFQVL
ncbi:hypothetical protein [Sorangium sp. Soce836]|uniref:hypothetical protein n=1 Tax=Sorangium sp. So ce836 TaxID=2969250 RepID=UPI0023500673|nr:hypothetical protein [Sorangium sp. Soce836]